jgi:branched-chain amino acid transport system permease protein
MKYKMTWILSLIFLFLIPFFVAGNKYYFHIIIMTLIWIMIAISINVVTGIAGLLSIAHGGFFGIGAYTSGILVTQHGISTFISFPAAMLITGACSLMIGFPALKLRGSYFAIGTLIYGIIITMVLDKWESLTKGPYGLIGIPPENSLPIPLIGKIHFDSLTSQYYLILIFTIVFYLIMARLLRSPNGLILLSIKEKGELTESLGVDIRKHKLLCFTLSSVMMGIAGALYAHYIGFLSPEDSSIYMQFQGVIFCVIGGLGTLLGPIIGSVLLNVIPEFLHFFKEYRLVFLGVLLISFVTFFPHGIMGLIPKNPSKKGIIRREA